MINIQYNVTTGDIITAYDSNITDKLDPHITVTEEEWDAVSSYKSTKVDLGTLTLTFDSKEPDRLAAQKQISSIDVQLNALDLKSIRSRGEIMDGTDTDGKAAAQLAKYKSQIAELRAQRATLTASLKSV